jgi:hypothetical protein
MKKGTGVKYLVQSTSDGEKYLSLKTSHLTSSWKYKRLHNSTTYLYLDQT